MDCEKVDSHVIPKWKRNTKQHVEHADNDGDFHLVGVHEDDLVSFRQLKIIIETLTPSLFIYIII